MDNGKISTYLITLAGIIFAYVIANPMIIEQMMGTALYAQYGAALLALLAVIYNFMYPRVPAEQE
jgi:hypothetical protein